MDHFIPAAPPQYRLDLVRAVTGDARGILAGVSRQTPAKSLAIRTTTITGSPRWNVPSTERTPAGSNERPFAAHSPHPYRP